MRKQTAEKVVDLLGLVEQWLADGRPRKPPGKPRPDATTFDGIDFNSPRIKDIWCIARVSLPAAFRLAAKEQGYSRYVQRVAAMELLWSYDLFCSKGWDFESPMLGLRTVDEKELDTRELIRAARAARRYIERNDLS